LRAPGVSFCSPFCTAAIPPEAEITVVMAAKGYPEAPEKGAVISGLPTTETTDCAVFHAGTTQDETGVVRVSGGRVLCVTALGDSVKMAQTLAYEVADRIQFDGRQMRRDIGARALNRSR
jgi:phosphoribosylamine--glycine ligase